MPRRHGHLLATVTALAVTASPLAATPPATGASLAATTAEPRVVTTYDELRDAVSAPCTEVTVRVGEPIVTPTSTLATGCDATIDLDGQWVALESVTVADDTGLTVTDLTTGNDSAPGTLQIEAAEGEAGVDVTGAALIVAGRAQLTADGGAGAAGVGGGVAGDGGQVTVRDLAGLIPAGGTGGAGIGGGDGGAGGRTTVQDDAFVIARGRAGAAGIGGGDGGDGGTTVVTGTASVGAQGGTSGAGVGGGDGGDGGATAVSDAASLGARGGDGAAGIGGGSSGDGGATTIADDATVSAQAWSSGGGAGIGGGSAGDGGTTVIDGDGGTAEVLAAGSDGVSAVGAGSTATAFGALSVDDGVLNVLTGALRIGRGTSVGPEVVVGPGGVIESRAIEVDQVPTGGDGRLVSEGTGVQAGRIANGGSITLPTDQVDDDLEITDHHYLVSFDANANAEDATLADGSPDEVEVFAESFEAGERDFPADPTRPDHTFAGWNTAADGSGETLSESSVLDGSSADGEPVAITAYAQWTRDADPEALPAVTASVSGQPKVGRRLTARAALAEREDGVSFTYQWLRDGEAIAGAESRTYRPRRADIARGVSVEVTASAPGRTSSSDTSRAVAVRPVVGMIGAARVGELLTPRVFVPEGARATYRWETSQAPARGAQREWREVGTRSTYTLRPGDARQRVRLVVTITGDGFSRVVSYSPGRFVRR